VRILVLDTALGFCSAAVFDGGGKESVSGQSLTMDRGHAEALIPLVESVMADVPGGFSSLDRIAVTVGPGSFTGLRVALSAARAFGFAAQKPVFGISTLQAFAEPWRGHGDGLAIASVIDARHKHVYFELIGCHGESLHSAAIVPIDEAVQCLRDKSVRLVGSAASLLGEAAAQAGLNPRVEPDQLGPDPKAIALFCARSDATSCPPSPLYLRPPDVTPQTGGRIARK